MKLQSSLGVINYRLYASLLVMGLCPAVYTAVRIHFLGQLPDPWSYSIAGQLGWVNLVYEIIQEAVLLPLFYFMGQAKKDLHTFSNRVRSGLLVTACIYAVISLLLCGMVRPLLRWMAVEPGMAEASASYICLESFANSFGMLCSFTLVALVTLGQVKFLYILTLFRLILSIFLDSLLISTFPFSLRLGVNGIGYSNLIVNGLLFMVSLFLLSREGVQVFSRSKLSFGWMKEFFKVGGISGLESFVRNIAYMLMIVRMVNVVQEQGLYWVANNFIWGWLLLPVTQLAEVIKQEVSADPSSLRVRSHGYFLLTGVICILWVCTIPAWKPFMKYVLGYADVDALFRLVMLLLSFYMIYAFQNIFDAAFYALGKTNYMLFESIVTNALYYGGAFILYRTGIWLPSLTGIALLFGLGIAFDGIVSLAAYLYLLKKEGRRLEICQADRTA
ncbi:MATE family Na+-driven efflux transporter [Flavonifractor sp. HCP28S3_F3]|uniref:MATE family Na+-driven efflux transporter n=1 Tax=Flavonifractor sp. HCP28S3_F3 TaxID=3438939 RepID=UPI003F89E76B